MGGYPLSDGKQHYNFVDVIYGQHGKEVDIIFTR